MNDIARNALEKKHGLACFVVEMIQMKARIQFGLFLIHRKNSSQYIMIFAQLKKMIAYIQTLTNPLNLAAIISKKMTSTWKAAFTAARMNGTN